MLLLSILFASSIFSNVAANVIGGIIVLIVTIGGGAWASMRREKRATEKELAATSSEKLDGLYTIANEMHIALVGALATPINPFPPPGLVDTVPDLLDRMKKVEHTLFTNGGKNNTIVDRMERLERALDSAAKTATRIETKQSDQAGALGGTKE